MGEEERFPVVADGAGAGRAGGGGGEVERPRSDAREPPSHPSSGVPAQRAGGSHPTCMCPGAVRKEVSQSADNEQSCPARAWAAMQSMLKMKSSLRAKARARLQGDIQTRRRREVRAPPPPAGPRPARGMTQR